MTPGPCHRHPRAAVHRGLCTACLLEEAIAPAPDGPTQAGARFTIQVPLGITSASSVFLASGEWPWRRLLRLKTWRRAAPSDFIARFAALQAALDRVPNEFIVMPLAAWTDGKGRPFVLTEFQQGLPLLDCVASGRLSASDARDALAGLAARIRAAHARGLSHGSIVPGNVLWRPNESVFLLDFGLEPCLTPAEPPIDWPQSDLAGFASLEHSLLQLGRGPAPQSVL